MINDKNTRAIAKIITIHGYRNSPIEDLHAGIPLPKKYMNAKYSRISDTEMKYLNKKIHNQIYSIIYLLERGKMNNSYWSAFDSDWDEAELESWAREVLSNNF